MYRSGKGMAVLLALLLLLPVFAHAGEAAAERFDLVPDGDQRMRYEGVFFSAAWPDEIADDMAACFPGERVMSGVYYVWQPVAGGPLPIVFAACGAGEAEKLVGAWHSGGKWNTQIISDRFFRPGEDFDIVMKPGLDMEGRVRYYQPAVRYGGEWFAFGPSGYYGFRFDHYERERDWAADCPEGAHMIIELLSGRDAAGRDEQSLIVYSRTPGQGKTEIWRGRTDASLDGSGIDAAAFPSTLEEAYACCEPNG